MQLLWDPQKINKSVNLFILLVLCFQKMHGLHGLLQTLKVGNENIITSWYCCSSRLLIYSLPFPLWTCIKLWVFAQASIAKSNGFHAGSRLGKKFILTIQSVGKENIPISAHRASPFVTQVIAASTCVHLSHSPWGCTVCGDQHIFFAFDSYATYTRPDFPAD